MMKRYMIALTGAVMCSVAAMAGNGVGLVLSGGGAKGVAHIGVIQALEDNDIPIDYITGTSMGAIVGSLYAAGYSPAEMMELLSSPLFVNASQGKMDASQMYLFYEPEKRPTFFNMTVSTQDSIHVNSLLPASLISPMPMNFAFIQIYGSATAACAGDFDRLMVPFRCVASDMTAQRPKVWREGALEDAVRSSMSFPIVFHPVQDGKSLLYDGGIYDNFPVDVMRDDFAPDVMLGVDVHASESNKSSFPDILSQMDLLVMRPSDYSLPADEGMALRLDLNRFSLLDFDKSDEIYRIGYEYAMANMDSIKARITERRSASDVKARRAEFNSRRHGVEFDNINVTGGTPLENEYVSSLFAPAQGNGTLSLDRAFTAYSSAISTGMLSNIEPQARLNKQTGLFDLDVKLVPKGNLSAGIGGYLTTSSNSMLYLQAGYNSLSFKSLDASLGAWLGQNYMAGALKTTYMFRSSRPQSMSLMLVAQRQKFYESDKLFYDTESPAFIRHTEYFGRLSYGFPTARTAKFEAGVGGALLRDSYYNNSYTSGETVDAGRNMLKRDLGQLMVKWELNTLDDIVYPTSGRMIKVMGQGIMGTYILNPGIESNYVSDRHHDRYLQLEVDYRDYFALNRKLAVGIESTLVASTRHLIKDNYNASVVAATPFRPTAASYNVFNPSMRANSFITAGVAPVYKFSDRLTARGSFHAFVPWRPIEQSESAGARYGKWFSRADFYGEVAAVFTLPFASLSVYGNYQTIPGNRWGVGVSFGIFILAPRFLQP